MCLDETRGDAMGIEGFLNFRIESDGVEWVDWEFTCSSCSGVSFDMVTKEWAKMTPTFRNLRVGLAKWVTQKFLGQF